MPTPLFRGVRSIATLIVFPLLTSAALAQTPATPAPSGPPPMQGSVALITGALPAQYGGRTAGIIDIQTKTGRLEPGGSISMDGGSRRWLQPSFEYGAQVGPIDYFITGEFLHNDIGIENPTSSFNA